MKNKRYLFISFLCLLLLTSCASITEYPETRKVSQTDSLHGIAVEDPYRWLEDFTSEEVGEWVELQNGLSQKYLTKNRYRKRIKENLESIWVSNSKSIPQIKGEHIFYFFNEGNWQQSKLMKQECDTCLPEVMIDPNTFSVDGTVSLSNLSISPDGKFIAYSISDGGSDWKTWKVLEVETNRVLEDSVKWTKFSSGNWESDNSGFYYQKYPEPKEVALSEINRSPKLYFHKIGTSQEEDLLIYERPDKPNWSWDVQVSEDGLYRILSIGEGTDLWFFTNKNSPNGKIVKLKVNENKPFLWEDVIKEASFSISGFSLINNKFVIEYLVDSLSKVDFFNLNGDYLASLDLPNAGSVSGFNGKIEDRLTYFSFTNYVTPSKIFKMDMETLDYQEHWSEVLPNFNSSDFIAELRFYDSKDGTKIPLHISYKKDTSLEADTPILLYGYGGFNISILPSFSKTYLAWMNQGGVVAVANLRGGSEYGDVWHEAGMLLNKQNVFDDFAYAAKFLHLNNIGSPKSTVIQGRSNGGLLVGATMLQNPELFAVTIPQVGVMDMLRFSKFTIGWAWESDYGSVDDKEEFLNLLSYSPYHNIGKGKCYPPTLITTANRDDRVVPSHSFKFAARLQELQGCDNPILLRVETRAGHGSGTPRSKRIEEIADIYGYALSVIKKGVN